MADEKIIFSMNGVGKVLPHNNKVILKDIYLSFFYGAKIGIIGLNGSGKSTLLKIIAGVEKGYKGEVVWAPGYSVGYLEQEPQMDPDKTVLEVVQEGVQEVMRAHGRRPDEQADRAPGRAHRTHRAPRRLGDRLQARTGHGRAPVPAFRGENRHALRR
jgi:ATPase subunit of ABC transporter with duplicated ATPase domains